MTLTVKLVQLWQTVKFDSVNFKMWDRRPQRNGNNIYLFAACCMSKQASNKERRGPDGKLAWIADSQAVTVPITPSAISPRLKMGCRWASN